LKTDHQMALDTITTRLIRGRLCPPRDRSQRTSATGVARERTVSVCISATRRGKAA
jgi:hypothetical protein